MFLPNQPWFLVLPRLSPRLLLPRRRRCSNMMNGRDHFAGLKRSGLWRQRLGYRLPCVLQQLRRIKVEIKDKKKVTESRFTFFSFVDKQVLQRQLQLTLKYPKLLLQKELLLLEPAI